ncbi:MAG: hypothetical protein Q4F18_06675 [Clostridia bacterium]|nr:hypothetical protein [Clostridia bacterium]
MVRMSILRNYPVICGKKQLGLLQSISLDTAQKRVCALIVSCGMRGKRVVLPEDVESIADGFILAGRSQKYKRGLETSPCVFVRDTTGLLAGRVTDYAIDEQTLGIEAIEMIPGYLPAERRNRLWMYAYVRPESAPELTVPACLGSELIFSREGTEICACPP